jgi:cell division topological specificity factor
VFEFIQRFFGKPTSSATAKERLRLVLLSDHLSLAPDVVDALKHDLVEVISRYVEVDAANCDVTFEQREKQVAMLANIPILGMRSRPTPPAAPPPAPPPPPAREPDPQAALDLGGATASVADEPAPDPAITVTAETVEADTVVATAPAKAAAQSNAPRKRRRKRSAAALASPG